MNAKKQANKNKYMQGEKKFLGADKMLGNLSYMEVIEME